MVSYLGENGKPVSYTHYAAGAVARVPVLLRLVARQKLHANLDHVLWEHSHIQVAA